jgi:[acyl-carrier-protein] S-malonyltransferase
MAAILGLEFGAVVRSRPGGERPLSHRRGLPGGQRQRGGRVVVSGTIAAVERAMELAKTCRREAGFALPVSAPFHSALMAGREAMEEALERRQTSPPSRSSRQCRTEAVANPEAIRLRPRRPSDRDRALA